MRRAIRAGRALWLLPALIIVGSGVAAAQAPGLGAAVELVDPHVFRVCADPRNLPFSDEAGAGFENKIAALFAAKLHKTVEYTYYPQVIGMVRNTLNAFKCDVLMGTAQGDDLVQTTNPYYRTVYALLIKRGTGLDDLASLDDPRLKTKRIGVVARTPPVDILAQNGLLGMAKPYQLTIDTRHASSSQSMVDDLNSGNIDVGVLWGPMAGYYATRPDAKLLVVPLAKVAGARLDFRISMGVRHSDQNWKRTLNQLIASNATEINAILRDYGVPLLDEQGGLLAP